MLISAVILAGGKGERLGQEKATLRLGGRTLLERVAGLVALLSDDLVVVKRADQELTFERGRVVNDLPLYTGALAGLAAGLGAARHPWSLVVACDMPFLSLPLLRYMLSLTPGQDIVVPRLAAGLEPLHALYHRRCLGPLRLALEQGQRRLVSFYPSLRVRQVTLDEIIPWDPHLRSFYNINTPEDLAQAEIWLRAEAAAKS